MAVSNASEKQIGFFILYLGWRKSLDVILMAGMAVNGKHRYRQHHRSTNQGDDNGDYRKTNE